MSNDKAANQLFRELMDRSRLHIRIGGGKHDATEVRLIGTAYELHGPNGCCTCCPREGESSSRQGEAHSRMGVARETIGSQQKTAPRSRSANCGSVPQGLADAYEERD